MRVDTTPPISPTHQQLGAISAELRATNRARLLESSPSPRPSVNPAILDVIAAIRARLLAARQATAAARAAAAAWHPAAAGRQQAAAPAVQEDAASIDLPAAVSDFTQDQACMRRYFAACRGTLHAQCRFNPPNLTSEYLEPDILKPVSEEE